MKISKNSSFLHSAKCASHLKFSKCFLDVRKLKSFGNHQNFGLSFETLCDFHWDEAKNKKKFQNGRLKKNACLVFSTVYLPYVGNPYEHID